MHHHRHAYFERPFLRIGLTWFLWLTLVVQAICIIMARNHYTVDIIVACYVCPMLYYTLQNIYESPTFKRIYPSYMGNFEYKHESAQHCSERFQNLPFVKCLTRLGSFVSRKLGFSVRILFLLSLDSWLRTHTHTHTRRYDLPQSTVQHHWLSKSWFDFIYK